MLTGFLGSPLGLACEACKLRQPKMTRGLVHGLGPESQWDWFLVGMVAAIALFTMVYAVKLLFFPGEKNKEHIKYTVFKYK